MCKFKSALCLKDRVFVPDYDSHDQMLQELGIPDDYLHASKTFVRVELSPADGGPESDPMGWRINIDQDILPGWFDHKVDELRVKEAIAEWCKVHVLKDGVHEVKDGVWYAYGTATVEAYDSATVRACGTATVEAYDSATVRAYGTATVRACGTATVEAYGTATVEAYDSATVEACGTATVRAYGTATVEAYGTTTVEAYGTATVGAYDSATVRAYGTATVRAYGTATVEAYDSATVILPKFFQTGRPVILEDEAICINRKTHTIKSAIKWEQE